MFTHETVNKDYNMCIRLILCENMSECYLPVYASDMKW